MLKKDLLELCLLHMLSQRDQYGYEMLLPLCKSFPAVRESAVYALLRGLRQDGFVETYQGEASGGPVRKYYRITPAGEERRQSLLAEWRAVRAAMEELNVM